MLEASYSWAWTSQPGPGRDVHHQPDADEGEERRHAVDQRRPEPRLSDPEGASGPDAPDPDQDAERRQWVERGPLGADGQAEADARRQQPRPEQQAAHGTPGLGLRHPAPGIQHGPRGHPAAEPVPVRDQAVHGAQDEERQEDVEQREPGEHQVQPVEAEQQAADTAQQGRAGDAPHEAAHHQDHQGADHGGGDPPAERVHPERLLAQGDQPLAHVGVHGQGGGVLPQVGGLAAQDRLVRVADVVPGVAEAQQGPGVLGVVGLVEAERLGLAQLPQPQEQAEQGHPDRRGPADERVLEVEAPAGARGGVGEHLAVVGPGEPDPRHATSFARLVEGGAHEPQLYGHCHDRAHDLVPRALGDAGAAGARGDAHRAGRGRAAAAGRGARRRRRGGRRGHPPAASAVRGPGRGGGRPGGVLLRGQRGGPDPGAARGAARR